MKRRQSGVTLVEILVVAAILVFMMGTVYDVMRSGSKGALKGMTRIETTLEGNRLLQMITEDLKQACYPNNYLQTAQYEFADIVTMTGNEKETTYSWVAFPRKGTDQEAIKSVVTGQAPRLASRIIYRCERQESSPFKRLIREEIFHPEHPEAARHSNGMTKRVLSDGVYQFEITTCPASEKGVDLWWVYFQLGEVIGVSAERKQDFTSLKPSEAVLVDFYGVSTSDFFKAQANNPYVNPNWHTTIAAPPEP